MLFIGFHALESVLIGMWHGHTISDSLPHFFGWNPKGLLAVAVTAFILLLPFFGFREIVRVMGHREMRALLFERRAVDPRLT